MEFTTFFLFLYPILEASSSSLFRFPFSFFSAIPAALSRRWFDFIWFKRAHSLNSFILVHSHCRKTWVRRSSRYQPTKSICCSHRTFRSFFVTRFWLSTQFLMSNRGESFEGSLIKPICINFFLSPSSESINLTPKSGEEWPFLLHAQFTPRGHSLVMVHTYDIYYKTGPKSAQSYRITNTAKPGIIYNGVPDWLYEGS